MHLNISKLKTRTEELVICHEDEFYDKWWLLLCHIADQYESGAIADFESGLLSFTLPKYLPIVKRHISTGIKVDFRKLEVTTFKPPQKIQMKCRIFDCCSQEVFLFNENMIALQNNTIYTFEEEK